MIELLDDDIKLLLFYYFIKFIYIIIHIYIFSMFLVTRVMFILQGINNYAQYMFLVTYFYVSYSN